MTSSSDRPIGPTGTIIIDVIFVVLIFQTLPFISINFLIEMIWKHWKACALRVQYYHFLIITGVSWVSYLAWASFRSVFFSTRPKKFTNHKEKVQKVSAIWRIFFCQRKDIMLLLKRFVIETLGVHCVQSYHVISGTLIVSRKIKLTLKCHFLVCKWRTLNVFSTPMVSTPT